MISWLVAHGPTIGMLGLGFIAGVFTAAWRQLRIEADLDEQWVSLMREQRPH